MLVSLADILRSCLSAGDCYACWHAWLMSLVHADFSCLEEATRMTVNDWLSFGSTTILKSRCSMSWPLLSDLALRWAHKLYVISTFFFFFQDIIQCRVKTRNNSFFEDDLLDYLWVKNKWGTQSFPYLLIVSPQRQKLLLLYWSS